MNDQNGKPIVEIVGATSPTASGIWINFLQAKPEGAKPTICIYQDQNKDWVFGFYKDTSKASKGCDIALSLTKDGPVVQIVQEDKIKIINLLEALS